MTVVRTHACMCRSIFWILGKVYLGRLHGGNDEVARMDVAENWFCGSRQMR